MSAQKIDVLAAEREQAEAVAALLQGKRSAADWTRAAVANAKAIEARAAVAASADELRAISAEMRARKVNHGRSESATLIAWADRIDAALARVSGGAA